MKYFLLVFLIALLLVGVQPQCVEGCSSCQSYRQCDSCQLGWTYDGWEQQCQPCPEHCQMCQKKYSTLQYLCYSCQEHFYLDSSDTCLLCDENCESCQGTPKNCTSCSSGYVLTITPGIGPSCERNASCLAENCQHCSQHSEYQCLYCQKGYSNFLGICLECTFPCKQCEYSVMSQFGISVSNFLDDLKNVTNWNSSNQTNSSYVNSSNSSFDNSTLSKILFNVDDIDILNIDYWSLNDTDRRFLTLGKWINSIYQDAVMVKVNAGNLTMNQFVLTIQKIVNDLRRSSFQTEEDILGIVSNNLQSLHLEADTNFLKFSLHSEFLKANTCQRCLDKYSLFAGVNGTNIGSVCYLCGTGCSECSGDYCSACEDGYTLINYHRCIACDYPCSKCYNSSTSSCLACEAPYHLNFNNQCVQCLNPCKTCSNNDSSYCETCFPPYSLYAEDGDCVFCDDANCQICAGNQTSVCYQCADGYLLKNKTCTLCPANCQWCLEDTICNNCMDGFGVSNNRSCISCMSGCKACTQEGTFCQQCFEGMYVDSNGSCTICPSPCKTCDSPKTCTTFEEGKVEFGTFVVDCRPGCLTCDSTSPQLCTSCEEHYFLSGTHCLKCSPSCRQCSSISNCSDCEYGYALVSEACQPCGQGCIQCQPLNPSVCQACEYGLALINGQCLYKCEGGCIECDLNDPTICFECDEGYALRNNGKCIKCLTGCSGNCNPENITECLGCKDGFQLLNETCVRCPTGCEACFAGECTACRYRFELKLVNNRFTCREECFLGCDECDNASTCSRCIEGLTLSGNDCVPNVTFGQSYGFCPLGTIKVNSQCVACSQSNCASCDQNSCYQCFDGYYANNSQCTPCISPCENCVDSQTCMKCADGHFLPIISKGTATTKKTYGKKCKPCHSKCLTCEDKARNCLSCPDTHRLNGTKCVSRYVVLCVYVFDFDYNTFLQEGRMLTLIDFFVALLSVDSDQVIINSVRQGSTQVSVGISSENQGQASQNLQTISNNEGNIPLNVLSSNVGVYYDDKFVPQTTEETATSSSNLGLIIGVAIGAAVVVAIIAFACYKYRTRKDSSLQVADSTNQIREEPSEIVIGGGRNRAVSEYDTTNVQNIKMIQS